MVFGVCLEYVGFGVCLGRYGLLINYWRRFGDKIRLIKEKVADLVMKFKRLT